MDDSDEWVRYTAVSALDNFKPKESKLTHWQAWQDDPSAVVRQRAYLSLAEHDYVGDPRPVMAWMEDEDAELRRHTLKIMGRVCATEAAKSYLKENKKELGLDYCTEKISRGLKDPDPEVRKAAVEALAYLNDKASKQVLEETMPQMDKDLQELARAALRSMQAR